MGVAKGGVVVEDDVWGVIGGYWSWYVGEGDI